MNSETLSIEVDWEDTSLPYAPAPLTDAECAAVIRANDPFVAPERDHAAEHTAGWHEGMAHLNPRCPHCHTPVTVNRGALRRLLDLLSK